MSRAYVVGSHRAGVALSQRRLVAAQVVFLSASLLGVAIAFAYSVDEQHVFVPYLMLLVVLASWTWLGVQGRSVPGEQAWLRPPVLVGLWIAVAWGTPGLVGLFSSEPLTALSKTVGIDTRYSVQAMSLVVCGTGVLWVGYLAGIRAFPLGASRWCGDRDILLWRVAALYAVTVIVRLWRIRTMGLGYGADAAHPGSVGPFDQWLSCLLVARYLCLALAVIYFSSRRWGPGPLITILVCELAFAFASAWMKPLLWVMVVALGAASVSGWSLRRARTLPLVAVGGVLLLVMAVAVVPVALKMRSKIIARQFDQRSPAGVVGAMKEATLESWGTEADVGWSTFQDKMTGRQMSVIHGLGVLLRETPSRIPYQGIEQLLVTPVYLVPRALWPDKPRHTKGLLFSIVYLRHGRDTRTSTAITIFGEPYMDAGWVGMLLALSIVGLLHGCAYNHMMLRGLQRASPLWIAMYLTLLPTLIDVEAEFTSYTCGLVQFCVVLPIIGWVLVRRRSKGKEA